MMKNIYTLLIALVFASEAIGQSDDPCGSCFPEGILFESQAQIDSFQYNYPYCTDIIGDVNIGYVYSNNYNITNLDGLSQIVSIGGSLYIRNNQSLTSLSGLENISFIGDVVEIIDNEQLISLTGLEGLSFLSNSLRIFNNDDLIDLSGLHNLDSVGSLNITANISLPNLLGLDKLAFCESLQLTNNDALANLTGLENLNSGSLTNLRINGNTSLSTCETSWLCNYLDDPGGSINIYNNAAGCDSPHEIADICGVTLSCLPYGNYYFTSQVDIDEFSSNYPDCNALEGNVQIRDYGDITDLTGLSQVTSITGGFAILNSETLSGLAGLDNITNIGGLMIISGNDSLLNFMGLDNLTSSGGMLIWSNPSLSSMIGLENLIYTESLSIMDNPALESLTGLDNINADSLDALEIMYNYMLSQCEIKSICEYLSASNGPVTIEYNATGCYDQWQVLDSCESNAVEIPEHLTKDRLSIYPNPAQSAIRIELAGKPSENTFLSISNTKGQELIIKPITDPNTNINIEWFPAGIYIVKIWNDKDVMVQKVMKQ